MTTTTCSTVKFENGGIYQGDLINDNVRHGYGVMNMKNGHSYRGSFENNKRSGYGVYEYPGGEKYEGHFSNNRRSGYGVYTYSNNTVYSGYWNNNLKEGTGTLVYKDGIVISGIFLNGDISYGEIRFANDSKYIGSIESYLMEGHGTMTYSDGFQIQGEFHEDMLIVDNEFVCCYCLESDCEDHCYETYEGICGNQEVFDETLNKHHELKAGKRVRTKIIENDMVWTKPYFGVVKKVNGVWSYVKFDDGDYLMIKNDLLEVVME